MTDQAIIGLVFGVSGMFVGAVWLMIKSFQSQIRDELEDMNKSLRKLTETFLALDKNVAVMSKIIDIMSDEIERFREHVKGEIL